ASHVPKLLRSGAQPAFPLAGRTISSANAIVGDVGRPDLAQKGNELTMEDLAGMMYDSIRQKLVPLADDVIVYPAHGPGSSCGKNLGPNTFSTMGTEKETNYALRAGGKEEFIKAVTEGLGAPPAYFPVNARINKEGYDPLDAILDRGMKALSVDEVKRAGSDVIILDTRPATLFTLGFVPGSVSIGLEGRFAEWAGSLLPFDASLILVTEPGKERESMVRLARVGFSKMTGYLEGGFDAWRNSGHEIDMVIDVEPDELAMDLPFDENLTVLDVRRPAEFADGHVKDAVNLPLNDMNDPALLANIGEEENVYIHCAGGYRSVIAASLLKRHGIHNIRNVLGGWNRIKSQEKIEIDKEKSVLN
ncbi:MAG TPA: rhodanese-like domain-containing protein, partial [Flavisolibacter sp.]